jgi:NAD+ synthase (glutamine-hydrolysing)
LALRLALGQINPTVGDLPGNARRILDAFGTARDAGAEMVLLPELSITGYPPEDLLLQGDFVRGAMTAVEDLATATAGLTAIVGGVFGDTASPGVLYNSAFIFRDGALIGRYDKQCLPNYGVFDEHRYFRAGTTPGSLTLGAYRTHLSVCEDVWIEDAPPFRTAVHHAPDLVINISASPYHVGKGRERETMLRDRARVARAFVAYCNMVGGQDELVFDGQSMVIAPDGTLVARAAQFREELLVVDLPLRASAGGNVAGGWAAVRGPIADPLAPIAEVYEALVTGTRDYLRKCGFRNALIGLSGGIDSALTAAIAADALGADAVTGVSMPTRYSSEGSIVDSQDLAERLGVSFHVLPIDALFQGFLDTLQPLFGAAPGGLAEENLQPRIRGTLLMALSNKHGALVLTTGNKSETAVGYSTLYGDTAGGYAVLKDVPKTLVYELARHRNTVGGRPVIPQAIIDKAPSAELRPDQKDTDSLPEYDVLDDILRGYVEQNASVAELVRRGFDEATVRRVVGLIDRSEYKRRQSPPGVKITPRAFGRDWRLPIAQRYER